MKNKYRIRQEITKGGSSCFYIQKRFWGLFWVNMKVLVGYDVYSYVFFQELQQAKDYIIRQIELDNSKKLSKIQTVLYYYI